MSSLWSRTQNLPNEYFKQVELVYGDHFPIEVRFQLATWIEENFFNPQIEIKSEEPGGQQFAFQLAQQLLHQLDKKAESTPNDADKILTKKKLQEMSYTLKQRYQGNMVALYMTVKQCLEQELSIVSAAANLGPGATLEQSKEQKMRSQLQSLKQRVTQTGIQLKSCMNEQEVVTSELYSFNEQGDKFSALESQHGPNHEEVKKMKMIREKVKMGLTNKFSGLCSARNSVLEQLVYTTQQVKEVQSEVLDKELIEWKRQQQLAGNGFQMTLSLETLQEWCEALATVIWDTRQHVKELERLKSNLQDPAGVMSTQVSTQELSAEITNLLSSLVTGTFIIEKQPPQVMKTNTRFTSTVRLLVGGQLNVHMASPSVHVSIISEAQANLLLKTPNQTQKRREDYNSGDILNGHGNMEFHANTRQVSATFRNLQLKRIKRTEKKGTESVMEEKFSVLFWTEFQISELKFQVWTLSLPVVVIVHGNQEPQALATITWDNAFAEQCRPPFRVPDKVPWSAMASALNMKWTSQCGTSKGLTDENIHYLACKAFRNPDLPRDMFKSQSITWAQFCREPLPDRNFTFWEWFYRTMILTSNHLRGPWSKGYIMGFAAKQDVEIILNSMDNGTFILRFSDSELGGVTIAYVRQDHFSKQVFSIAPFTTKDLSQRSIADVVFDLQHKLTFVYQFPTPISIEAFREFSSPALSAAAKPTNTGYVPHELKTHVPGSDAGPAGLDAYGQYLQSPQTSEWTEAETYNAEEESMQQTGFDPNNVNSIDIQQILGMVNNAGPNDVMDMQ